MINALFLMLASTALYIHWGFEKDQNEKSVSKPQFTFAGTDKLHRKASISGESHLYTADKY